MANGGGARSSDYNNFIQNIIFCYLKPFNCAVYIVYKTVKLLNMFTLKSVSKKSSPGIMFVQLLR